MALVPRIVAALCVAHAASAPVADDTLSLLQLSAQKRPKAESATDHLIADWADELKNGKLKVASIKDLHALAQQDLYGNEISSPLFSQASEDGDAETTIGKDEFLSVAKPGGPELQTEVKAMGPEIEKAMPEEPTADPEPPKTQSTGLEAAATQSDDSAAMSAAAAPGAEQHVGGKLEQDGTALAQGVETVTLDEAGYETIAKQNNTAHWPNSSSVSSLQMAAM